MPAVGGRQPYTVVYRDHSGETKSLRVYTGEITALSIAGLLAELGDINAALDAVTLGVRAKQHWGEETVVSNAKPAEQDAQIETELLVRYIGDITEKPFSFRIPTVDYTKFNFADPPAGDQVTISGAGASAETLALIAALEATCRSPENDAETITIVGMEVVR
jgi:hypothetical protein